MEEYYYYLRDEQKRPIVTVCLIKHNGIINRGVAICSKQDNPVKKIGRNVSYGRAYRAFFTKLSYAQIILREGVLEYMESLPIRFFWKAQYNIGKDMFEIEKHIVYGEKHGQTLQN